MDIPFPPIELRKSVGPVEDIYFDNPEGGLIFGDQIAPEKYERFFDFGCGCGRNARQLLLQKMYKPRRYFGVDLYRNSIEWCKANLEPLDENFSFSHHDAFNAGFNPGGSKEDVPFQTQEKFTLVNAHSVFTHIVESHIDHYLSECARVLDKGGVFRATWFLFDKTGFPMMQEFQNCLYINPEDPTNATIYDVNYVQRKYEENGLIIFKINPPAVRGFQWDLIATNEAGGQSKAEFPDDVAPIGIVRPPLSLTS